MLYVKCGSDDVRLGLVKSYADGLYRIETDKEFIEKRNNDIAYTSDALKKRINFERYCNELRSHERNIMTFDKNSDFVI